MNPDRMKSPTVSARSAAAHVVLADGRRERGSPAGTGFDAARCLPGTDAHTQHLAAHRGAPGHTARPGATDGSGRTAARSERLARLLPDRGAVPGGAALDVRFCRNKVIADSASSATLDLDASRHPAFPPAPRRHRHHARRPEPRCGRPVRGLLDRLGVSRSRGGAGAGLPRGALCAPCRLGRVEFRTSAGRRSRTRSASQASRYVDRRGRRCRRVADPPLEVVAWLARSARRSRRVASVCTGAFLLARAGLLDGRRATTHWRGLDRLAAEFPRVQVERDALYVSDGKIYSSAGISAGMDLALALVEEDLGRAAALAVARQMVLYLKRPGGQSQFSQPLEAQTRATGALADLPAYVASNLNADLSVANLAKRVALSPRHFSRVFAATVGCTPAKYVETQRVASARELLDAGGPRSRGGGAVGGLRQRRADASQLPALPDRRPAGLSAALPIRQRGPVVKRSGAP